MNTPADIKSQITRNILLLWAQRGSDSAQAELLALGKIADYVSEVWEQGYATGQHETAQQWIEGIRNGMADVDDAKLLIASVINK